MKRHSNVLVMLGCVAFGVGMVVPESNRQYSIYFVLGGAALGIFGAVVSAFRKRRW